MAVGCSFYRRLKHKSNLHIKQLKHKLVRDPFSSKLFIYLYIYIYELEKYFTVAGRVGESVDAKHTICVQVVVWNCQGHFGMALGVLHLKFSILHFV